MTYYTHEMPREMDCVHIDTAEDAAFMLGLFMNLNDTEDQGIWEGELSPNDQDTLFGTTMTECPITIIRTGEADGQLVLRTYDNAGKLKVAILSWSDLSEFI